MSYYSSTYRSSRSPSKNDDYSLTTRPGYYRYLTGSPTSVSTATATRAGLPTTGYAETISSSASTICPSNYRSPSYTGGHTSRTSGLLDDIPSYTGSRTSRTSRLFDDPPSSNSRLNDLPSYTNRRDNTLSFASKYDTTPSYLSKFDTAPSYTSKFDTTSSNTSNRTPRASSFLNDTPSYSTTRARSPISTTRARSPLFTSRTSTSRTNRLFDDGLPSRTSTTRSYAGTGTSTSTTAASRPSTTRYESFGSSDYHIYGHDGEPLLSSETRLGDSHRTLTIHDNRVFPKRLSDGRYELTFPPSRR